MTAIKHRSSSFELYRIIVMMAIVAHHYVVNSGLMGCLSNGGASCQGGDLSLEWGMGGGRRGKLQAKWATPLKTF